jgi:glycosyltransferase involved in cell wall biosynthesis
MDRVAKRPLRILEIETFGRGGLIHYAYNLSCALAERGHDVTLVTTAGYELGERALPDNLHLVEKIARFTHRRSGSMSAGTLTWVRKIEALWDVLAVTAVAGRLRPDVIHFHCTNPVSLAYLALLRLVTAPVVATAHVVTPHERIPFQEAIYRRVHGYSDLIVAHSEFDRRRLTEEFAVDPERAVLIPHGEYGFFESGDHVADPVEARRRLGLGASDEVVLFFGYIREYKGLDVLLEAWNAVVEERPGARLLIAGDPVRLGPARRNELEAWADRLGAVHRFDYIPFSDVAAYFGAADVLVMPYRSISQSGVLYLALSLGVPVVATRVGGLPELLRDGDSALLVPPESPPDLAKVLVRLLGDRDLRARLVDGGRRVAERHSWPSIAERTEDAFYDLCGDRS